MKGRKMKNKMTLTLAVLALGASAFVASAQDNSNPPGSDGSNRPHPNGHRPTPPAIIAALDANHDGVIDADEIANASAALKSLDKNGDGQLTPDEFMGPRPAHRGNDSSGQNPPDGMPPEPPPN